MKKPPGRGEGGLGEMQCPQQDGSTSWEEHSGRMEKTRVCAGWGNLGPKNLNSTVKMQSPGRAKCLTRQITAKGRNNHSFTCS